MKGTEKNMHFVTYFIIEMIRNILYFALAKVQQQTIKQDSIITETTGIEIIYSY